MAEGVQYESGRPLSEALAGESFFFNDPSTPDIYTLSLHDALPIFARLEDACEAAGRDPATIDRVVVTGPELDPGLDSEQAFAETSGRYAEAGVTDLVVHWPRPSEDRKSTRLNSSHVKISYAVFCLK